MGSFKLGGSSLKGLFSKPATRMYPVNKREFFSRSKGHIVNTDIKTCITCGLCQRKCPTGSITVDKVAGTWTIDPFDCIQCSSCVRVCPKQVLIMNNEYTLPATKKHRVVVTKPPLTPEEQAAKEKADAEKAAKIAAAKAAKAKRDAENEQDSQE